MQKAFRMSLFAVFLAFAVFSVISFASAATFRAVPQGGPIVADGQTLHTVMFELDTTDLVDFTSGAQAGYWFDVPAGYSVEYVDTFFNVPNDFFAGFPTGYNKIAGLFARLTDSGAVPSRIGNVAGVTFRVHQTNPRAKAAMGGINFLDDGFTTYLLTGSQGQNQVFPTMIGAQFQLIPSFGGLGSVGHDGVTPVVDAWSMHR